MGGGGGGLLGLLQDYKKYTCTFYHSGKISLTLEFYVSLKTLSKFEMFNHPEAYWDIKTFYGSFTLPLSSVETTKTAI